MVVHLSRCAWLLVLVAASAAGCLDADDGPEEEDAPDEPRAAFDAGLVPQGVDWWEDFSTRWIKRDANLPMNQQAMAYLSTELDRIGFDVEVRTYPAGAAGTTLPEGSPLVYYVVVGTREGTTTPDHRIGLVSHYDTQTLTFQGAYDDASGVAAQFTICESLAAVELDRTLACIFFDGEERGLLASQAYVQDVVVEGDEAYVYDFVVGYDMTGINWPGHDWKMYLMTGGDEYVPTLGDFARPIMHDVLGYPEDGVEVLDTHDRNSDERRFRDVGVPIFRFAGGRTAGDYPQYHMPQDTVEYVYDFVGGRENFEAGFGTIVEASHHLVVALDGTDIDAITAGAA